MENSFRVRVDKAFGSLTSSTPSSSPLWCLTDEEIERREWNRGRDSPDEAQPKPYTPHLDGFFTCQKGRDFSNELEADVNGYDDYENDDVWKHNRDLPTHLGKPDDHTDQEWSIRSSIGFDCTLDYEEEEDVYDKVAIGGEKAGVHMYMKDLTGCGADDINFYDELPSTFQDITRDPRANHIAAKLRLKEDAEAAGMFESLQGPNMGAGTQNNTSEESTNLKSTLKGKANQTDPHLQKRVRFDPQCGNELEEEFGEVNDSRTRNSSIEESRTSEASSLLQHYSKVPDYIRNPSKYTHYTFDLSSDVDEESNQKTCLDFLNQLKGSNSEGQLDDKSIDLPKSIAFTPNKNLGNILTTKRDNEIKKNQVDAGKRYMSKKGWVICIADGEALEAQDSKLCAMEEGEPEKVATKNISQRRQRRRYRVKPSIGSEEPVT